MKPLTPIKEFGNTIDTRNSTGLFPAIDINTTGLISPINKAF